MRTGRVFFLLPLALVLCGQETVDLNVVHRIKTEAFKKSKVMDHLATLTDRFGPRLTASKEYDAAAEWTVAQLREWGLQNARVEQWGPFGRAWSLKRFSLHMTAPQYAPLIGLPLAWSEATKGVLKAEVVNLPVRDSDMEKFRIDIDRIRKEQAGKLKGRIVMITASPKPLSMQLQPAAKRYTEAELAARVAAEELTPPEQFDYSRLAVPDEPELRQRFLANAPRAFREALNEKRKALRRELHDLLRREGVVAVFVTDRRGDGGTVFGESAGWYEAKYSAPLPTVALTPEHYNRMIRLIARKTPVTVELDLQAELSREDVHASNVFAEIPGGAKKDEVVIVGAHLDSWQGATGATDNGVGCAVAMEAVRILKALNLKLDRTVRIALWSGEEQGLYGSKEYVKKHLADPKTMQVKPDHERVSVYLNLDNGSGKIRGVYLQGNDAARPVFERWLSPFRDLGVTTITIRNTSGTDHLPFDAVGIPAFQFIQDPLEYMSRSHHSNMDTFERAQGGDLMQASAVMASVIYHAANRAEKVPRKPLPEPEPAWAPGAGEASGNP
jgi:hypothetical protein